MAEKTAHQQPPSPVRSGMRHNEDIRCIVSTFLFFLVFVITWHYFSSPLAGGWVSLTLWLSLFQLSFMGAVTTHNAIHLPVFWSRNWNNFYQICLSLQYGGAVTVFIPGHNLSHHKYPQQARDVMRTTKVRYSWNLLNGLLFFWHVVLSGNKDDKLYFEAQARLNRPIVRQRRREEIAVWGTTAVLILIDWRRWIWFALLPQFYAKYCILSLNFLQHDGCDMSSKYNFARNFTGITLNYLCFNNGYHTVHHLYPGLHWSVLPEKHQELIGPHIAKSLESSNILVYMWKSFIYPGLRLDYKGRRLVITREENEMPDEPWFYDGSETFSNTKEYLSQDTKSDIACEILPLYREPMVYKAKHIATYSKNGYGEVMKSAPFEAVIHTASPFLLLADDIKKIFMDPAILGTTGLLEAVKAYAPTVNRVVITSSLATAAVGSVDSSYVHSARDWVEVSEEKAYSNSWDGYVAYVLGPIIHGVGSLGTVMTSGLLIRDFLSGNHKDEIAPSPIGRFTDVRDAAMAHVRAIEVREAGVQRSLVGSGIYPNRQVATILWKNFPALLSRLLGPEIKSGGFPVEGVPQFDVEPSKKVLGIAYATLENTIVSMTGSMVGLYKE
ncbi:alkanal monooxygenase [Fusarium denticulatum]|uniref:Alkanal monooxygenase n=1 Tax=Fusarium denticulatum TaxID=48507 RepID=A0A8H6CX34_9HYPO|nr:alkanal monooxygenase [Fusarium denticulatum]